MGIMDDIKRHLKAVKENIGTQSTEHGQGQNEPTIKFGEILWVVIDDPEGKAINVPFAINEEGNLFTNLVNGESFPGSQLEYCAEAVCKSIGIEKTHFLVLESSDMLKSAIEYLPKLGDSRVKRDFKAYIPSRDSKNRCSDFCHSYSVSQEDLIQFMNSVSQARDEYTAEKRTQARQDLSSQVME